MIQITCTVCNELQEKTGVDFQKCVSCDTYFIIEHDPKYRLTTNHIENTIKLKVLIEDLKNEKPIFFKTYEEFIKATYPNYSKKLYPKKPIEKMFPGINKKKKSISGIY